MTMPYLANQNNGALFGIEVTAVKKFLDETRLKYKLTLGSTSYWRYQELVQLPATSSEVMVAWVASVL